MGNSSTEGHSCAAPGTRSAPTLGLEGLEFGSQWRLLAAAESPNGLPMAACDVVREGRAWGYYAVITEAPGQLSYNVELYDPTFVPGSHPFGTSFRFRVWAAPDGIEHQTIEVADFDATGGWDSLTAERREEHPRFGEAVALLHALAAQEPMGHQLCHHGIVADAYNWPAIVLGPTPAPPLSMKQRALDVRDTLADTLGIPRPTQRLTSKITYFAAASDKAALALPFLDASGAEPTGFAGIVAKIKPKQKAQAPEIVEAWKGVARFDGTDVEPIVVLAALEALLTGADHEQLAGANAEGTLGDNTEGSAIVVRLSPTMAKTLAKVSTKKMATVVPRWSQIQQFNNRVEPADLAEFAGNLHALAAIAKGRGHTLYAAWSKF